MAKRFTKQNPTVHPMQQTTYRVPIHWAGEFAIKTFGTDSQMQGDLVNKLGKYEDLGEPEEIARRLGKRPDWLK